MTNEMRIELINLFRALAEAEDDALKELATLWPFQRPRRGELPGRALDQHAARRRRCHSIKRYQHYQLRRGPTGRPRRSAPKHTQLGQRG
jgi:hypothetical protein